MRLTTPTARSTSARPSTSPLAAEPLSSTLATATRSRDAGRRPAGGAGLHRADQQARAARPSARRRAAPLRRGPRAPRPVIHLDLDDLLHVAARTLGEVQVRDIGLLESALARPQTTAFAKDAYPSMHGKAAALPHSLARDRALVDGNIVSRWPAPSRSTASTVCG